MKNKESFFYRKENDIASAKPTNIMKALSDPSPAASTKLLAGFLKFDTDLGLHRIKCILIFAILRVKT